jgi:hypothetical protein
VYDSVVVETRDTTRERQRLQDEYSRMMDGELEQLALVEVDLTELARQVLREQMSLRGLPQNLLSRMGAIQPSVHQVFPLYHFRPTIWEVKAIYASFVDSRVSPKP